MLNKMFVNNVYKDLIPYAIKKGKKLKIENLFRKTLFEIISTKNFVFETDPHKFNFIVLAIKNTTPIVNIKTKRKGSRHIQIPFKISKKRAKFLSASWLIINAKSKKLNKFTLNFLEELIESSKKTSLSFKKCNELNILGFESLTNINISIKD